MYSSLPRAVAVAALVIFVAAIDAAPSQAKTVELKLKDHSPMQATLQGAEKDVLIVVTDGTKKRVSYDRLEWLTLTGKGSVEQYRGKSADAAPHAIVKTTGTVIPGNVIGLSNGTLKIKRPDDVLVDLSLDSVAIIYFRAGGQTVMPTPNRGALFGAAQRFETQARSFFEQTRGKGRAPSIATEAIQLVDVAAGFVKTVHPEANASQEQLMAGFNKIEDRFDRLGDMVESRGDLAHDSELRRDWDQLDSSFDALKSVFRK